jgi:hypothetical protein
MKTVAVIMKQDLYSMTNYKKGKLKAYPTNLVLLTLSLIETRIKNPMTSIPSKAILSFRTGLQTRFYS